MPTTKAASFRMTMGWMRCAWQRRGAEDRAGAGGDQHGASGASLQVQGADPASGATVVMANAAREADGEVTVRYNPSSYGERRINPAEAWVRWTIRSRAIAPTGFPWLNRPGVVRDLPNRLATVVRTARVELYGSQDVRRGQISASDIAAPGGSSKGEGPS